MEPKPRNPFNKAAVPIELRKLYQWVCWKYDEAINAKTGKRNKIPINAKTLGNAGVGWPNTWSTLNYCIERLNTNPELSGVGLVLTTNDPYVAIDLDSCYFDGRISEDAQAVVDLMHGYTEVSPSGKGLRILVKGEVQKNHKTAKIEIYTQQRWVTITGKAISTIAKIPDRQNELNSLVKLLADQPTRNTNTAQRVIYQPLDDERIWQTLFNGKNGSMFRSLFDGDTSPVMNDESRAVIFLGNALALFTQGDHARIKRLLYQTNLKKDKWETRRGNSTWLDWRITDCINYTRGKFL